MRWFHFPVFMVIMVSCTEISFKEPQPKGIKKLKSFPASLQGSYLIPEDSIKPDTIIISKQGYRITGGKETKDILNNGILSDTLVLKKYKGYYFLNFYLEKQWLIRTFRQEKNGDIVLMEINLTDDKTLQNLMTKLHPEVIKEETNTFYKVDAKPQELLDYILANHKDQEPLKKIKN